MASSEIKYTINVDASRANRGLTQFSRAAQDAGKDAVTALDDTATAGEQARAALEAMATAMETEMKQAAEAAEALGKALGPELAARMDPAALVGDFQRMGVGLDELKLDADKFALSLKKINLVDLAPAKGEVDTLDASVDKAGTSTDDMSRSAGGAKSALANMIGNSAQDVSGLSSSLGVAIGQMAEYSADAILAGDNSKQAFKNMALVAGPIAGLALLTAGIDAVKGAVNSWKAEQQAFLKQQTDFNESVRETGSQLNAVGQLIEDNVLLQPPPEMNWFQGLLNDTPLLGGMLDDTAQSADTVATSLAQAGISQREWFEAMRVDIPGGLARYNALNEELLRLKETGQITGDQFDLLSEQFQRQGSIVATNSVQTQAAGEAAITSVRDITSALQDNSGALVHQDFLWRQVLEDLADGKADTQNAAAAWSQLREELGLTESEMAALTQQKLDEQLAADTQAAGNLAQVLVDVRRAADDYNNTVTSAEFGAAGFEAAGTAVSAYFDELFRGGDVMADQQDAFDGMAASLEAADEAGLSWFETLTSVNSPEGRQVRTSMRQLADSLLPDIQQAYVDADGDQAQFEANMSELATGVLSQMQSELGLTTDEANALGTQLGLTPEMVQTTFRMIGIEEAKLKLGLLQGSIDALPDNVETQVTQRIITGDYQGALAIIENYYNSNPVGLKVVPEIDWYAVSREKAKLQSAFPPIKVTVQPRSTSSSSATSTAPTSAVARGVGVAPMAAAGPTQLNVHIHAAAVGNRYDVERVVAGAVRQAVRLGGRRNSIAVPA